MLIQILTLFPEMFEGPLNRSILKRAQEQKLVEFKLRNFREYAFDKHRMVDDSPYGGGSGMVLKPEPVYRCLEEARSVKPHAKVLLMTPQGTPFRQSLARQLAELDHLIIICGHYEGFDERIRSWADWELSIGDFVLTGGELAAMVVSDAVIRLIPGALGSEESAVNDSFATAGLLDYPHYTRPAEFMGMKVPEVLQGGHHAQIEAWRRREALLRTARRRPELLRRATLSETDKEILLKELNMEI
jgi:tRNA (guanine37-N1)-methyltransferase